jgi:hypothetical protein
VRSIPPSRRFENPFPVVEHQIQQKEINLATQLSLAEDRPLVSNARRAADFFSLFQRRHRSTCLSGIEPRSRPISRLPLALETNMGSGALYKTGQRPQIPSNDRKASAEIRNGGEEDCSSVDPIAS